MRSLTRHDIRKNQWLPTVGNNARIEFMRTAATIGFSIEESDRPRLKRLTDTFGGGNRSAFLRTAMDVMERYERAQRLARLQAYGAQHLASSGRRLADITEIVAAALANPAPETVAQAKLIVADIVNRHNDIEEYVESSDDSALREVFNQTRSRA